MDKLRFGTGGIPLTTPDRNTENGVRHIRTLGLDHMELEFVRGVKMGEDKAIALAKVAAEVDVSLSVHGPYYVNLASEETRIFYSSIKYIADSIYIGGLAGAKSVTFHPAAYQKRTAQETYDRVVKALGKIYEEFENKKFDGHPVRDDLVMVAPELTGKPKQFGDLKELVSLVNDFKKQQLRFCFDFAHKFARSNGKFNTYDEFSQMLEYVEKNAGREYLESMHIHVSAIMHSEKGERNHVTMLDTIEAYNDEGIELEGSDKIMTDLAKKDKAGGSKFNWRDLLKALKAHDVKGMLVCESPSLELDALLMQKVYANL